VFAVTIPISVDEDAVANVVVVNAALAVVVEDNTRKT
jgi:hypothetical protein